MHSQLQPNYYMGLDGTPVSNTDIKDLEARVKRKEKYGNIPERVAQEPQLMAYLANKPGGDAWTGNAPLREYVAREEARERAIRLQRQRHTLRSAAGSEDGFGSPPRTA